MHVIAACVITRPREALALRGSEFVKLVAWSCPRMRGKLQTTEVKFDQHTKAI